MTDKTNVLIVEDNQINAKLLMAFLAGDAFNAHLVEDGRAALDYLARHRDVDVILLDRMMPNMDGIETLMAIKRWDRAWHIPVIMLTAALSPKQIEETKMMGAYACLPKPYNKEQIIAAINAARVSGG